MPSYRFLLDEHMVPFPGLPLDLFGFELLELRDFDSSLVNIATPDWLLYLEAAKQNLTGIITHDPSQLEQELEIRAMQVTGISVITYKKGTTDELTKWGLLMAYAPRIIKSLDAGQRGAVILPAAGTVSFKPAAVLMNRIGRNYGVGTQELRHRADRDMREALEDRAKADLWPI